MPSPAAHSSDENATASMKPGQEIRSRLVLNFPGFEKTDSDRQLGRLLNSARKTGEVWNFSTEQHAHQHSEGTHFTIAGHVTSGEGWQTETKVVQFRWNDIVDGYENAPFPGGFLRDLGKFLQFFADGTVRKYRKASLRYWGFTIYPFLLALIFAAVSATILWFVLSAAGISGALFALLLTGLALLSVLLLCKWPGTFFYIPMTIADWGFARDMVNRSNAEIETRFEEFGNVVAAEIAASDHDEITVVGHSFGAVWAAESLARALHLQPDAVSGKRITFLALGSSIPKIALASGADWLRGSVAKITGLSEVFWHEFQTKDDFIAFYKADPFEILEIASPAQFRIDRIRFSKGIKKKRYREIRKSMYRTHRQYILYYDKKVAFDTMIRLFGPFSARTLAGNRQAADLSLDLPTSATAPKGA